MKPLTRARYLVPVGLVFAALLAPWTHPDWPRLEEYLFDLTHVPAGALLVWTFRKLAPGSRSNPRVLAGAVALLLVELVQPFIGRDASLLDWLLGLTGAMIVEARAPSRGRLYVVRGALLAATVIPAALLLGDRIAMHRQFPVLSEFRRSLEQGRWVANGGTAVVRANILWLEVDGSRDYPGLFLEELVADWSEHGALHLELYLQAPDPRSVVIRVDDTAIDAPAGLRGEVEWKLKPGRQTVTIPLKMLMQARDRSLDYTSVQRLGVFFYQTHPGEQLGIGRVELREWIPETDELKISRVKPAVVPDPLP